MIDLSILRTNPNVKIVITHEKMEEDALRTTYYRANYTGLGGIPADAEKMYDGDWKHVQHLGLAITGETDWYTHKGWSDSRIILIHPAGGYEGTIFDDPDHFNKTVQEVVRDMQADQGSSGPTEIFLADWQAKTYVLILISYRE